MYIMGLGGKPTGECYYCPPDKEGVAWLVAHYYSGGNVKLIKFKEPLAEPEDGSPIKRIEDLEEFQFYIKAYAEKFIKDLCDSTGVTYKTLEEFKPEAGTPPEPEHTESEMSYMVNNIEMYSAER